MQKFTLATLCSVLCAVCAFSNAVNGQTIITALSTNKSLYTPGNAVTLKATLNQAQSGTSLRVRYFHLSSLLTTVTVNFSGTNPSWNWTLPANDNRGYMVGVELMNGTTALSSASIAVNVASDYRRFPVNGFLSKFPFKTDYEMDVQMDKINRYHINVLQFYDFNTRFTECIEVEEIWVVRL